LTKEYPEKSHTSLLTVFFVIFYLTLTNLEQTLFKATQGHRDLYHSF